MHLAANRNSSPDHIAVQINRTGCVTSEQRDHLWRSLFAELLVVVGVLIIAANGFGSNRMWLVAVSALILVANTPRVWDLTLDVFGGRCDSLSFDMTTPSGRPAKKSWPHGRHQLTWQHSITRGDALICSDDDALLKVLQAMPAGTCYVARHTRLAMSVTPAAKRLEENDSLATILQINDMAIGSIMHRLVHENETPTGRFHFPMPVLIDTVRGDALAVAALLERSAALGKSLMYRRSTQRRTQRAHRAVDSPEINLRGKPAGRISIAR